MNLVKINSINIWDEEWELGYYDNGVKYSSNNNIRSTNYIEVEPNTSYYLCANSATIPSGIGITFYNSSKTYLSVIGTDVNRTFTTPANTKYITFFAYAPVTTYHNDIQICLDFVSQKTTYHPHWVLGLDGQGKAFTADISSMLPSGIGCVDLGSLNWTYNLVQGYHNYFEATVSDIKQVSGNIVASLVCSNYDVIDSDNLIYGSASNCSIASRNNNIRIYDTNYNDAVSFKSAMSGQLLFYKKNT